MLVTLNALPMGWVGGTVPFGSSDPMGCTRFYSGAYNGVEDVLLGRVITYNPNTHTATVQAFGTSSQWSCRFADEPVSLSYGYSCTFPPREGEFVLVRPVGRKIMSGVIIGRMPIEMLFSGTGDEYNDPDQYHRRLFTMDDLERRTWDRNVPGMMKPMHDEFNGSTHIHTHLRPTDVYPGEFANVNQHNCGIKGGMFSATLLGGGASVRVSALSNLARVTCETYQRHSMSGSLHEFHNGRFLSSERDVAVFQEERLGGKYRGQQVWTPDAEAPIGGENQAMRPRFKELSGYFGNVVSRFCLRPDPGDAAIRVMGEGEPTEQGVFRETVDPSGQTRISSSGMLVLERAGRIPVPVRTAYPTDKGHDISEGPDVLTPFEHKEGDPALRQVELYDRQAYDLKNQYSRVDGNGAGGEPDYYTPQEEDMGPSSDAYDSAIQGVDGGSETVKLAKYDRRRAGVYVGEDGSVIIRDAWGSEIVMLGGNVTIACAGSVMSLPGKTALTIAGDDIVQKAQNSVDIHASAHDVRLSAARNMEILGGANGEDRPGGVVIESRGNGMAPWGDSGIGEGAAVRGITIRTKGQGVVIDGNTLNLRSRKDTRIISGGEEIEGNVSIAAKTLRTRARSTILSAREGDAHLIVNGRSVQAVAGSIGMFSEKNLTLTKGDKFPVPLMWADVENVASEFLPEIDEVTTDLADEKEASLGFSVEALDKMSFSFRTAAECGTDRSWTIGAEDNVFRMYQPAWAQVMRVFETLSGVKAKAYSEQFWEESGSPFPGAGSGSEYARLSGDKPANLTDKGFNASRKEVLPSTDVVYEDLEIGYLVRG